MENTNDVAKTFEVCFSIGKAENGGEKMADRQDKQQRGAWSDEQAVRKDLTREYDHEFANEPMTENEKQNNKKTKKRQ